jgi:hypothetical protein
MIRLLPGSLNTDGEVSCLTIKCESGIFRTFRDKSWMRQWLVIRTNFAYSSISQWAWVLQGSGGDKQREGWGHTRLEGLTTARLYKNKCSPTVRSLGHHLAVWRQVRHVLTLWPQQPHPWVFCLKTWISCFAQKHFYFVKMFVITKHWKRCKHSSLLSGWVGRFWCVDTVEF